MLKINFVCKLQASVSRLLTNFNQSKTCVFLYGRKCVLVGLVQSWNLGFEERSFSVILKFEVQTFPWKQRGPEKNKMLRFLLLDSQ
jgi:hypothetical protein